MKKILQQELIDSYNEHLKCEEKSPATIQKYLHDISEFKTWIKDREVTKPLVLSYKAYIIDKYAVASVNSVIAALNSFFSFMDWNELKIKSVKVQKPISDYTCLCSASALRG